MRRRSVKIPGREQMEKVLADIGGEALDGSGFEDEAPEEGFSDPEAPETSRTLVQ